jgi:hypothetical protein
MLRKKVSQPDTTLSFSERAATYRAAAAAAAVAITIVRAARAVTHFEYRDDVQPKRVKASLIF